MMRGEREVEKNGQGTITRERKKRRLIALALQKSRNIFLLSQTPSHSLAYLWLPTTENHRDLNLLVTSFGLFSAIVQYILIE